MPNNLVRAMARQGLDTGRMARRCGVSAESMGTRRVELGIAESTLIPPGRYERQADEFAQALLGEEG